MNSTARMAVWFCTSRIGIDFHQVHADQFARFGDHLAGEVRFAVGQPTRDRSPDPGAWRGSRASMSKER